MIYPSQMPQSDDSIKFVRTKSKEKVINNKFRIGHTRLTHGYLMMAKYEKPMYTSYSTDLSVGHILTD